MDIEIVNQQLRAAGIKVSISLRGKKLYLVATLPEKHGKGRKQQRIAIHHPNTPPGLREAKKKAYLLWQQLVDETFRWSDWINEDLASCQYWIDRYKDSYLRQPGKSEATWRRDCLPYLKQLPANRNLSLAILRQAIEDKRVASRSRQLASQVLTRFGQFAGLNTDELIELGTGYNLPEKKRELPSEQEIEAMRDLIKNPKWQRIFGLMAAYGLRDHECWACKIDPEPPHELWVLDGKTGSRGPVFSNPTRWAQDWRLWEGELPTVTWRETDTNRIYGDRTSTQFKRYGLPITPYTLRHAYAVREIQLGLHPTIGARLMGHSVLTHTRTYHRWITEREIRQEWARVNSEKSSLNSENLSIDKME